MLLLALAFLFGLPAADTVGVSAELRPDSVLVGESAIATITLWREGDEAIITPPEQLPVRDLQVTGAGHAQVREIRDGREVHRDIFTYIVTPLSPGMCYLEPLTFKCTRAGDTAVRTLSLPALALLARRPAAAAPPWSLIAGVTLILALLLAGLVKLIMLRRGIRAEEAATGRQIIVPRFLARIRDLKTDDPRAFCQELFRLLREFLQEQYELPLPPATVAAVREFLHARSDRRLDETLDALARILYANEEPADNLELLRMRIKNYLRDHQGGEA